MDNPIFLTGTSPMKVLNELSLEMLAVNHDHEVYAIIANALKRLIGNEKFIISWLQPDGKNIRIVEQHGFTEYLPDIRNILGVDPYLIDFPVDNLSPERLEQFRSRKLTCFTHGLYGIALNKVSRQLCRSVEHLTGIDQVYAMGISVSDRHYGGLAIFAGKKGSSSQLFNEEMILAIESIINFSALLIKRLHDQKKLEEQDENLQTFFNSVGEMLFVVNTWGNILTVNKTVTDTLGYTMDEMAGMPLLNLHPAEFREEALRITMQMMTGKLDTCPIPIVTRDGRWIPVETRVSQGVWNGQPVLFGVTKNISKLKSSEEKFSKAFHINPMPMAISSKTNGCYIDVNEAFLEMTGYRREEVIGISARDLNLFAIPEQRIQSLQLFEKQGYLHNLEVKVRIKDGSIREGLFAAASVRMQDSEVLLTVMHDITDRKNAETDHQLHLNRIRMLLELHDNSLQSNSSIMEFALQAMQKITGGKMAFLGKPVSDLDNIRIISSSKEFADVCRSDDQNFLLPVYENGILAEVISQRKPYINNHCRSDLAKERGFLRSHLDLSNFLAVPIFDGDRIVLIAGMANKEGDFDNDDIISLTTLMNTTWELLHRRETDEELQKSLELLKEVNRSKDKFMSIIAHDLRSPFNVILGFASLLATECNDFERAEIEQISNKLFNAADNYMKLLENLLLWSQTQTGIIEFKPCEINISETIRSIIDITEPIAIQKNISITSEIRPGLMATCDKNMVEAICRNLLVNAIKYTKPCGSVTVSAIQKDGEVVVSVADTGVGIKAGELKELFTLGHKHSTPGTRNEKGTGLGLILCREFVEKHGGKIRVESEAGIGSTFSFTLPYRNAGKQQAGTAHGFKVVPSP